MLDVYRTFYKLTGEPFRLSPDHRFSLGHRSYANAKAYLDYALLQGEGFIAITGGPGTGKTTLIADILAGFEQTDMQVATLTSTQLESRDLLQMVAHSFDLHPQDRSKANLLMELERFLNQQSYRGHRTILIVDEAQSLSPSALEELRLLANMQRKDQLLLQIFLVGQEKLLDLISAPGMEQLQQRLVAASVLEPLDLDETVDYVEHRLRLVAWQGDPAINEAALRLVHRHSGGIPRRINVICNRLFLYGGMQEKHQLDGEDARMVIEELQQEFLLPAEPPSERTQDEKANAGRSAADATVTPVRSLPRAKQYSAATDKSSSQRTTARQRQGKRGGYQANRSRPERFDPTHAEILDPDLRPSHRVDRRGQHSPSDFENQTGFDRQVARRAVRQGMGRVAAAESSPRRRGRHRGMVAAVSVLLAGSLLAVMLSNGTGLDGLLKIAGLGDSSDSFKTLLKTGVHKAVKELPDHAQTDDRESQVARSRQSEPDQTAGTAEMSDSVQETSEDKTTAPRPPVEPAAALEKPRDTGLADTSPNIATGSEVTETEQERGVMPAAPEMPDTGQSNQGVAAATQYDTAEPDMAQESYTTAIEAEYGKLRQVADERFSQRRDQAESATIKTTPVPRQSETSDLIAGNTPSTRVESELSGAERSTPQLSQPKVSPAGIAEGTDAEPTVSKPITFEPKVATPKISEPTVSKPKVAQTTVSAPKVSVPKVSGPTVSEPKVSTPKASQPKITIAAANATSTSRSGDKNSGLNRTKIRSALLEGQWTSQGKPASLLPSEITFCNSQGKEQIGCWSVAQNINTKYGPALYKVETTLKGFSAGSFKLTYRTLVKLVEAGATERAKEEAASSKEGWQVTEHAMKCQLTQPDTVLCRDQKGVTRNYRRAQ